MVEGDSADDEDFDVERCRSRIFEFIFAVPSDTTFIFCDEEVSKHVSELFGIWRRMNVQICYDEVNRTRYRIQIQRRSSTRFGDLALRHNEVVGATMSVLF